jgi:hypothetical protein
MRKRPATRFEVVEVERGNTIGRVGDLFRSQSKAIDAACELDRVYFAANGGSKHGDGSDKVSRYSVRPVTL